MLESNCLVDNRQVKVQELLTNGAQGLTSDHAEATEAKTSAHLA